MYDFTKFVQDVVASYKKFAIQLDNQNNIIVTADGRTYLISAEQLRKYYNAFTTSGTPYIEAVSRTVGIISQEIDKWYEKWH